MLKFIPTSGLFFIIIFLPAVIFAQEQDWQVSKSTHFNIFYKNAPEEVLSELSRKAEECYDSIGDQFGFNRFDFWTWDSRARIYLFDSQDEYMQSTQSSSWAGGQVDIGSKLIQTYVDAPGFLQDVLPHELAHIVFVEMVGYNNPAVPLWLQEGVATYQQKDIRLIKGDLAEMIRSGQYLNFEVLNSFQTQGAGEDKVRLFYAEAYSLVNYLITAFGKEEFVEFCRSLRDSRSLAGALNKIYAFKDFNDFEESWKNYILK
jgi:Peptidase MA superfamily